MIATVKSQAIPAERLQTNTADSNFVPAPGPFGPPVGQETVPLVHLPIRPRNCCSFNCRDCELRINSARRRSDRLSPCLLRSRDLLARLVLGQDETQAARHQLPALI